MHNLIIRAGILKVRIATPLLRTTLTAEKQALLQPRCLCVPVYLDGRRSRVILKHRLDTLLRRLGRSGAGAADARPSAASDVGEGVAAHQARVTVSAVVLILLMALRLEPFHVRGIVRCQHGSMRLLPAAFAGILALTGIV